MRSISSALCLATVLASLFVPLSPQLAAMGVKQDVVRVVELQNPLGTTSTPEVVGRIIRSGLGVVGSISLLLFIYGGFLLLTSAGNERRIATGRNTLIWAIVGLVTIFFSYAALSALFSVLT